MLLREGRLVARRGGIQGWRRAGRLAVAGRGVRPWWSGAPEGVAFAGNHA